MNPYSDSSYYLYILTNKHRTALQVNITADWDGRLMELEYAAARRKAEPDECTVLLYWEAFEDALRLVEREYELRNWSRRKKAHLIDLHNPEWRPLNEIPY